MKQTICKYFYGLLLYAPIASVLEGECKEMVKILDWFHVGKRFKNAEHVIPVIPEELKDEIAKLHRSINKMLPLINRAS